MKRALRLLTILVLSTVFAYLGVFHSLRAALPDFAIRHVEAESSTHENDRSLPFFGLMVPVPKVEHYSYVPKLEYREGPPKRYLSRISFFLVNEKDAEAKSSRKERIEFYGRRTLDNWIVNWAPRLTRAENWSYAGFVEASLAYAQDRQWPAAFSSPFRPAAELLFLLQAKSLLGRDSTDVFVMDQAGIPAFLFQTRNRSSIGDLAKIWFLRRNTVHEVRMASDSRFEALQPEQIFRKSFLVEKRQDAMAFIANELSDVKLSGGNLDQLSVSQLEWPLLLLGAKLSVDPSSIHAFFHFAGLNALLFREQGKAQGDLEVTDSMRNNVLVSERYGRDIAPESEQSTEMGRLARALVQMLN